MIEKSLFSNACDKLVLEKLGDSEDGNYLNIGESQEHKWHT